MLRRIELTNFMSHEHTVIEPAAGLTVLVGPNNCGKSAVVAALEILCHNENSTYVLRHGQRECSVRVETDDGHQVEWRRKKAPSYVIDGQTFDRLGGGGPPDELRTALRLPKVDAGNDTDFDVHFAAQKSPIFLLGSSPAHAAKFFASSSDAIRLVEMQKRHKDKLANAQREKKALEEESYTLTKELESLESIVDLDERLSGIAEEYNSIEQREAWLKEAVTQETDLRIHAKVVGIYAAECDALVRLPPLPALAPTAPVESLIAAIATGQSHEAAGAARCRALAPLVSPPPLAEHAELRRLIERLARAEGEFFAAAARNAALEPVAPPPQIGDESELSVLLGAVALTAGQVARLSRQIAALSGVPPQPAEVDVRPLGDLLKGIDSAAACISAGEAQRTAAADALAAAEISLRERADESFCSLCGGPLDPDRVVQRAAAGLGRREHGH